MRRAVTTEDPTRFEIEEYEADPPGPGEVLLRVRASGICGSDLHAYRDASHWLSPEAGWQPGRVPGHEVAGEVAAVGEGVALKVGQRVALQPKPFCGACPECRGGRTEICRNSPGIYGEAMPGGCSECLTVPERNLFPVADDLDFAVAALAEPLAVAVHGHRVAAQLDATRPTAHERVVVLGAGPIGQMSVFYARQAGAADVAVTYRYPQQAEAARRLGATQTFLADEDGERDLRAWAKANPVDLVMETVGGSAPTPALAVDVVRWGGRVLLLGVPSVDVGVPAQRLLLKQLRLASTVFYAYIGMQHDFEIAIRLLEEHRDTLATLITHRVPLEEAARAWALAADKQSGAIKVTIEP